MLASARTGRHQKLCTMYGVGGFDAGAEFDRQVGRLVALGYPEHAGCSVEELRRLVTPLREVAVDRSADLDPPSADRVPFVLVVTVAAAEVAMGLTELGGHPGFTDLRPHAADRFRPVADLGVPAAPAYLVIDVERGSEYRNATPDDAVGAITARGRTPITVEEGIALLTHHPRTLERNHCWSLAGSRAGDRRVPAIWISKGAPRLGWCWAGNPHTWLGTASAGSRYGSDAPATG